MKTVCVAVFALILAAAAPAMADDSAVSADALRALGLGGMQVVSDEAGMQVRGMSSFASSRGGSIVFGMLIDPATGSFVIGGSANQAGTSAENAGFQALSQASHSQFSGFAINLTVVTNSSFFTGTIFGAAGGTGNASGQ